MLVDLKAIAHRVTDDELLQLSSDNPETKFETTKERKLLVMSPQSRRLRSSSSTTGNAAALRGSNSGKKNSSLIAQVWLWNDQAGAGAVFDSSTGFILSNGAIKSPDVSWIESSRWNELTPEQQDKFAPQRERADRRPTTTRRLPPSHPDFVIELLSPSDDLLVLQQKMQEYMDCGIKLGWLIDPKLGRVEVYRQDEDKEILNNPQTLSGEKVLSGFTLNLKGIL